MEGVLSKGVLSGNGLCLKGVMYGGGFVRGGFVRGVFVQGGFVRRGFCPRTVYLSFGSVKAGDNSFVVAAATLWNALPNNIKTSARLATFKARLKAHFF